MSITPLVRSVKLDTKLKEAIVSRSACGVQLEKKFKTIGKPLTVNKKQTAILTTKAITWFFVRDDIQDPIDKKPPAINKLPI